VLTFLVIQGGMRRLYPIDTGSGLLVISLIVLFCAMLWRSAARLSRADRQRAQSADALRSVAQFPQENPQPVLRIDAAGNVLYANRACAELLNDAPCEAGRPAPPALAAPAAEALRSGTVRQVEVQSSGRTFSFVCAPLPGCGYVNLYGRDVTEHKAANEALRRLNAELEQRVAQRTAEVGRERQRFKEVLDLLPAYLILLAPVWMQLVHLFLADAVWITLGLLALANFAESELRHSLIMQPETQPAGS
jgi:PAS domain-containing protein